MSPMSPLELVLAQSRVDELAMQFQHPPSNESDWFAVCVVILIPLIAAAAVAGFYQFQNRPAVAYCAPTQLFTELCGLHEIDSSSRKLLLRMAAATDVDQPAFLLTLPKLFDTALEFTEMSSKEHELATRTRDRLFG